VWADAIAVSRTNVPDVGEVQIPISTVEHENTQLKYGRTAPTCAADHECEAHSLPGNRGPLHVYRSLTETEKEGACIFCLLCIRRDAQAIQLAQRANTGSTSFIIPPFQNLVDTPGGYRAAAMGVQATTSICGVNIVGVSNCLSVRHSVDTNEWYIDQGGIVFGGARQLN
jgi:hypothetical protein